MCLCVYVGRIEEFQQQRDQEERSKQDWTFADDKLDLKMAIYFCDLCEELEAIIRTNQQRMQDREVCLF